MLRQNAYDCDWYRCRCVAICSIIEHPKHSCSVCSIAKLLSILSTSVYMPGMPHHRKTLYPYNSFRASLVKLRSQIRAELPEVLDPKDDREEDDRQTTLEFSGGPFRNVALEEFEGIDGDMIAAADPPPDGGTA